MYNLRYLIKEKEKEEQKWHNSSESYEITALLFRRRGSAVLNLFGLTVARQENNSDSDVIPESRQIQDLLMSLNNSPSNSPWERNLAKIH